MSSIQSLNSALSGLMAARRHLETHGHNVANAATEGYTRQRVTQSPAGAGIVARVFSTAATDPGGIASVGVERLTDLLMQNRLSMASDFDSSAQATEKYMMRIEDIFAEPSDSALSGQLTRFWGSWAALSISPESNAARQQVLAEADQLVYTLRRADTELTGTLDFASGEFNVIADEINNLTSQIADLNGAVVSAGSMTTAQSDLWDQRDRLVHRLSELTGATQRVRADGQVAVFISGRTLVDNKTILRVQATATSLQWEGDLNPVEAAGHVGALHTLVTSTIPDVRTKLDSVASSLVTQINALHSTGSDRGGNTGRIFFDPAGLTAGSIAVSTDPANGVYGHPDRVAAGVPGNGLFDGSAALSIAALADSATGPDSVYMGFLSDLGVKTSSARARAQSASKVLESAVRDYASVAQVNLDDELAGMTAAQRAYQASARVVTTIDDMLDDLIRRFGRVGT